MPDAAAPRPGNGVATAKVNGFAGYLGRLVAAGSAAMLATAVAFVTATSVAFGMATSVAAQPAPARPPEPADGWRRVPLAPGSRVDTRPQPPKEGRKACISVKSVAGAQLFGDSAIELTMKNGRKYRMFFASECPALSFYQGFYYRRQKAGQLCAGRDSVGARSGGECPIASIIPVRIPKR